MDLTLPSGVLPAREALKAFPGLPSKEFLVSETEWYDRVAFALEWLCRLPGVRESRLQVGQAVMVCRGNDESAHTWLGRHWPPAPPESVPAGWVYFFGGVRDPEYLRRLNEYPDETLQSDLEASFSVWCEDTNSFLTINAGGRG